MRRRIISPLPLFSLCCWLFAVGCDGQPQVIASPGPATDTTASPDSGRADSVGSVSSDTLDTVDSDIPVLQDAGTLVGCTTAADCIGKIAIKPCERPLCQQSNCVSEVASDGTPCTDGSPCYTDLACEKGECGGGRLISCDDGDPCTQDQCDDTLGCLHVIAAGGCDDGQSCTLADYCLEGACLAGNSVCPCIADTDCDQWADTNACGGQLRCYAGLCKPDPSTVPVCPSSQISACEVSGCDPTTGACSTIPLPDGTVCSDLDPCTTNDQCTAGKCIGTSGVCTCDSNADCLAYDDGNLCNGRPTCTAGQCIFDSSTIISCAGEDGPCTAGACDPLTGSCTATPLDGATCDDGNPCTSGDKCAANDCQGMIIDCDDSNDCTTDSCDSAGICQNIPSTGPCTDNDECTVGDMCSDGMCIPGVDQCSCTTPEDCMAFDDGNACNGVLTCIAETCQVDPGSEVTCDTSINTDCQINTCNPETGQCEPLPANEGAPCFDGDPCTNGEFCQNGVCGGAISECNCQPAADLLTCTNFPTKWANYAFGSTQNVDAWPCSPGDYSAKEFAWKVFTSQPVAMTVTLSNEDGKNSLFVIEDEGQGCSANSCKKTHPSSLTFVALPDKTQYVVVDAKDGESGEFELDVSCQLAIELTCNDGFDEDTDGQTDCNDPDCDEDPYCSGVEDCTNQLDDDNDGKVDCDDPDCETDTICDTLCTAQDNAYCGLSTFWATGGIGSTDILDTYSCSPETFDGSEVVYTFNAQATQLVTVSLPDYFPGATVFILQEQQGTCNSAYCIAMGPVFTSFFATAGATYYIIVDGQFGTEGDYKINIACE